MVKRKIILIFFVALVVYCMFSPAINLWLTIAGGLTFIIVTEILFVENSPNIIYLGVVSQWLGAIARLLYANFRNIPMKDVLTNFYGVFERMNEAYYLSLIAIIVFSIGLKFAIYKKKDQIYLEYISPYKIEKFILFYFILLIVILLMSPISNLLPGISQLLYYSTFIKQGVLLLLIALSYQSKRKIKIIWLILSIEFLLGFFSYFSDFKAILNIVAIFILLNLSTISIKKIILGSTFITIVVFFAILWGTIKVEYRELWHRGAITNPVNAITSIIHIYENKSNTKNYEGIENMLQGIGYIHFTSCALENVPKYLDYQKGAIWSDAIEHVLMPRMIFKNKKVLNDTEHLNKHTGLSIYGTASFSLGYIPESYIDFGYYFMWIPIFLLGFLIGKIYNDILFNSYNLFWGLLLAVPMLDNVNVFGRNASKILGQLILYYIMVLLLRKFVIPYIDRKLKASN